MKHKKLRNTAILFEILCRKLTNESLSGVALPSLSIIKKHFHGKSLLLKEYRIYQELSGANDLDVISLGNQVFDKLDKPALLKEKYQLVSAIGKRYNLQEFLKTPISNYRKFAAIYTILESDSPTEILDSRKTLIESNSKKVEEDLILAEINDPAVAQLSFKYVVERFNEKYRALPDRQKKLLSKYINEDISSESFRNYIVAEVKWIRNKLSAKMTRVDAVTCIKLQEISNLTETILSARQIKEEHLDSLLKYHELIEVL